MRTCASYETELANCPLDRCDRDTALMTCTPKPPPACNTFADQGTCPTDRCAWDQTTSKCGAKTCASFDQLTCPTDRCMWDQTNSACAPKACVSFDQLTCPPSYCAWNPNLNECAPRQCGSYNTELTNCPLDRCSVDTVAKTCNQKECISFLDKLTCPVDRCFWDLN